MDGAAENDHTALAGAIVLSVLLHALLLLVPRLPPGALEPPAPTTVLQARLGPIPKPAPPAAMAPPPAPSAPAAKPPPPSPPTVLKDTLDPPKVEVLEEIKPKPLPKPAPSKPTEAAPKPPEPPKQARAEPPRSKPPVPSKNPAREEPPPKPPVLTAAPRDERRALDLSLPKRDRPQTVARAAPPANAEQLTPNQLRETLTRLSEEMLYPPEALQRGLEGEVVIQVELGEDGRILDASIASGSGYDILDNAAVRAVRKLGTLGPSAANKTILLPVKFKIL